MILASPYMLWLLLLVLPVAAMHWRGRMDLPPARTATVAAVRIVLVASLVLALARPIVITRSAEAEHVVVVDVSGSVSDADLALVEAQLDDSGLAVGVRTPPRLVVFDAVARTAPWPGPNAGPGWLSHLRQTTPSGGSAKPGSALAEALDLATATIAQGRPGRVDLFSDGLATRGDARAAALRLGRRKLALAVYPSGQRRSDELVLVSVRMPPEARRGATVPLVLVTEAGRAGAATITVTSVRSPSESTKFEVEVPSGREEHVHEIHLDGVGAQEYRVACVASWDGDPANNELVAAVFVTPGYAVGVVESHPDAPARSALAAMLGTSATVQGVPLAALTDTSFSPAPFDLLVIADTPAARIPVSAQRVLIEAVEGGMGMLLTGGRQAFGPGGYQDTELAALMPVDFPQQVEKRDPSATVVIIIDTSGSMTGPRIALAKEIARLVIRRLQPHDKVGIVEFYGAKRWAARIQSAANAININRALNRLNAGGGTVILPAIEEAHYALLNVQTRTKHALIITDGGVETGPFQEMVTRMADAQITVSTVAVGPDRYSTFLSSLAHWGRGRFYAVPDRFNLPEIILKNPKTAPISPFVEAACRLRAAGNDEILDGIDVDAAPSIDGYVRTTARPAADLLLTSDRGEPLLARWRHGRGAVAALTTDLGGPWAGAFNRWPQAAKLFANLARDLAGTGPARALRVEPTWDPGGIRVRIDYVGKVSPGLLAPLEITVEQVGGTTRGETLDALAPGRWNHLIRDEAPGTYVLHAHIAGEHLAGSAALHVPPPREVTAVAPDQDFLDELAEIAAEAAAKSDAPTGARVYVELWPWLVAASLVLFVVQVLVRRLPRSGFATAALVALAMVMGQGAVARAAPQANGQASVPVWQCAEAAESECNVATWLETASAAEPFPQMARRVRSARQALAQTGCDPDCAITALATQARSAPTRTRLRAYGAALRGDLDGAVRTLDAGINSNGSDAQVLADRALYCALLGEDDAARGALNAAIAGTQTLDSALALQLRRVTLLHDVAPGDPAQQALAEFADGLPDASSQRFGGRLAALLGAPAFAVRLLTPAEAEETGSKSWLLRGLCASRGSDHATAQHCFEQAYAAARRERDRRFAIEQLLATARATGQLPALADRWLGDPNLPVDCFHPLVRMLRELGRPSEALAILERAPDTIADRELITSPPFLEALLATAIDVGRVEAAESVLRRQLEREPPGLRWRLALARLYVLTARTAQAEALLHEALQGMDQPDDLFELADAARAMALDGIAQAAVAQAARTGPDSAFRARLWSAELAEARGDVLAAEEELERVLPEASQSVGRLRQLADAYERFGKLDHAAALLEQVVAQTDQDAAYFRLAWLLEQTQQFAQARDLWEQIWRHSEAPAQRSQAGARWLDLAAKTGTLADVAIAFEQRVVRGEAEAAELTLLVDIYTRVGDAVSTAEVLYTFTEQGGDEIEALRQLVRAYQRMGRPAQADAALEQLIAADPPHALDYLQERMVLAVERQRPDLAASIIEEIGARANADGLTDELSAGVFALVGDHTRAVAAYERILTRHPERVEVWLLWTNAMRGAGRAAQAMTRLQLLAEEAEEDDLFLVALDGLLNLEAGPVALRPVWRRLLERIATAPQRIYLYDAAVDLLDALGRSAQINDLLEQALIFAGEQRGPLLCEMMQQAQARGEQRRVIQYGNILAALNYQVQPQKMLDLGEALLAEGSLPAAERAFSRARSIDHDVATGEKVADAYERALLLQSAQRVVNELLIVDPTNVSLLWRSAALAEQLDDYARASAQYAQAFELLIGRTPRSGQNGPAESTTPTSVTRRRRIAADVDEMTQFFKPVLDALITTARTDDRRGELIEWFQRLVEEELEAVGRPDDAGAIEAYPRLKYLTDSLRFVAICLHRPAVADRLDRSLLARFPADAALAATVVSERLTWGLHDEALNLAALMPETTEITPEAQVYRVLAAPPPLVPAALDPQLTVKLVPALVMQGRDEDALALMKAAEGESATDGTDVARVMMIASVALGEDEALYRWLLRYLDACRTLPAGAPLEHALRDGLRLGWNLITPEQRAIVCQRIERLAGAHALRVLHADLVSVRLWDHLGQPSPDRARVMSRAARELCTRPGQFVELLQVVDVDERLPLLEQAWAASPEGARLELLLTVAGGYRGPVDEAFAESFRRLLESSPRLRLDRFNPYGALVQTGWPANCHQPALGVLIADHIAAQLPDAHAVQVAVASAMHAAGDTPRCRADARQALTNIRATRKLSAENANMVDDLAKVLPLEDCAEIAASIAPAQRDGVATSIDLLVRAALLARTEDAGATLEALVRAFETRPEERLIRRRLVDHAREELRWITLSEALAPYVANRAIVQNYEIRWLAEAYRLLYQPAKALAVLRQDDGVIARIGTIRLEGMLGRTERAQTLLRRYLITNRLEQRFYTPLISRDFLPGGMQEYRMWQRPGFPQRVSLFAALAPYEFAAAEFDALWQAAAPHRRDLPGLTEARIAAAEQDHEIDRLARETMRRLDEGSFHARDLQLASALVTRHAVTLPTDVPEALGRRLPWARPDRTEAFETWARLCQERGDDARAAFVLRWLVAQDILEARQTLAVRERFSRLDLYLASLPAASRDAALRRFERAALPNPVEAPSDRLDGMILQRLAETGEQRLLDEAVQRIETGLGRGTARAFLPRIHRALAYVAARADDVPGFRAHLDALIDLTPRTYGALLPVDPLTFLPPADQLREPAGYAALVADAVRAAVAAERLSQVHATRTLALLGQWCVAQGLPEAARQMAAQVRAFAGDEPGERWLWVVDLLEQVDPDAARPMNLALLRAGLLPLPRVESFLDRVETEEGPEAADELAREVSRYSDHPAVLQRALRHAQRTGDDPTVRALQARQESSREPSPR